MKKPLIRVLFCIFLSFFIIFVTQVHAEGSTEPVPAVIELKIYRQGRTEKGGQQFKESAWVNIHGHHALLLSCRKDQLGAQDGIFKGMPVRVAFDSHDGGTLYVDDVWELNDNELLICLHTDGALTPEKNKSYDIDLVFFNRDMSRALYSATIKNAPSDEVAVSPQTGDSAVLFVLIAVVSIIFMAFLLSPKKSSFS